MVGKWRVEGLRKEAAAMRSMGGNRTAAASYEDNERAEEEERAILSNLEKLGDEYVRSHLRVGSNLGLRLGRRPVWFDCFYYHSRHQAPRSVSVNFGGAGEESRGEDADQVAGGG